MKRNEKLLANQVINYMMYQKWENNLVKNMMDEIFLKKEINVLKLGLKMSFIPTIMPLTV